MNYRNRRDEFERWYRFGKERGWMEKAADEVSSWFGDEEAELRRRMDQRDNRYENESDVDMHRTEWDRPVVGGAMYAGTRYRAGGSRFDNDYDSGRLSQSSFGQQRQSGVNNFNQGQYGYGNRPSGQRYETPWSGNGDYENEYQSGLYGRGRESEFFSESGNRLGSTGQGRNNQNNARRSGRGPKNYKRSDERISDDLHEQLDRMHHLDARDIDIEVKNGEVTLKGTVTNRFDKRAVEDVAEDIFGVKNVHNMIHVKSDLDDEDNRSSSGTQSTHTSTLKR